MSGSTGRSSKSIKLGWATGKQPGNVPLWGLKRQRTNRCQKNPNRCQPSKKWQAVLAGGFSLFVAGSCQTPPPTLENEVEHWRKMVRLVREYAARRYGADLTGWTLRLSDGRESIEPFPVLTANVLLRGLTWTADEL